MRITTRTRYAIRVPPSEVGRALAAGYQQSHTWSRSQVTDLAADYGADWVFGRFNKEEITWCRQLFDELAGADQVRDALQAEHRVQPRHQRAVGDQRLDGPGFDGRELERAEVEQDGHQPVAQEVAPDDLEPREEGGAHRTFTT